MHNSEPEKAAALMQRLLYEVKRVVVGQDAFLERVLIALLAQGHLLIEGVPGLAKTLTVNTLAKSLNGSFSRIQFTPDLLPADLIGTRIFNQQTSEFSTVLGPVFANLLLADEINRAPAKVQSALLEVMQERQVTIAGQTHRVPSPFLVMATQNPIETEGTYPLPEAQVDRFMMKVVIGYPTKDDEKKITNDTENNDCLIEDVIDDDNEYFDNNQEVEIPSEQGNEYLSKENRFSANRLTKYEMVRILGERTKQLTMGAKPLIKNYQHLSYDKVAEEEFIRNIIPYKIKRPLPNGKYEIWTLDELNKDHLLSQLSV
jgi:MoxR-like ATPase/DNA-directed RNA polymerase subunit K/omega